MPYAAAHLRIDVEVDSELVYEFYRPFLPPEDRWPDEEQGEDIEATRAKHAMTTFHAIQMGRFLKTARTMEPTDIMAHMAGCTNRRARREYGRMMRQK